MQKQQHLLKWKKENKSFLSLQSEMHINKHRTTINIMFLILLQYGVYIGKLTQFIVAGRKCKVEFGFLAANNTTSSNGTLYIDVIQTFSLHCTMQIKTAQVQACLALVGVCQVFGGKF